MLLPLSNSLCTVETCALGVEARAAGFVFVGTGVGTRKKTEVGTL